jgi:hypothetical protein
MQQNGGTFEVLTSNLFEAQHSAPPFGPKLIRNASHGFRQLSRPNRSFAYDVTIDIFLRNRMNARSMKSHLQLTQQRLDDVLHSIVAPDRKAYIP